MRPPRAGPLVRGPACRPDGGGRAAARRRPRPHRLLFAQGVHPADAAVPRHLPLLHLRARPARGRRRPISSPDEVLAIARAGVRAGCHEALFTLGDKPELQYEAARRALARLGYHDHDRLPRRDVRAGAARDRAAAARQSRRDDARPTSPRCAACRCRRASCWRSVSPRLCERGGPHLGSPDKVPAVRLATIEAAGRLDVPFTTGILIGIGETRARAHRTRCSAIARPARALRPHAGSHRPELPRQARHRHGARAGAGRRRAAVDRRGGADRVRAAA